MSWLGIIYDAVLVAITMGGIWLLPIDQLDRVNLEIVAVIILGVSIWLLHDKKSRVKDPVVYLMAFTVGVIQITVVVISAPVFNEIFSLMVHHQAKGGLEALFKVPGDIRNFFLFTGFGLVYVSIAGMLRILFCRLFDSKDRFKLI